jgi:hypothetical protein
VATRAFPSRPADPSGPDHPVGRWGQRGFILLAPGRRHPELVIEPFAPAPSVIVSGCAGIWRSILSRRLASACTKHQRQNVGAFRQKAR